MIASCRAWRVACLSRYPTYPRTAGYSGYEPSPFVDSSETFADVGAGGYAGGYVNINNVGSLPYTDSYASGWTPINSPLAPYSASVPWGYWANENLDYRPYNAWTGEGKYYAPYAEAYYYYDPASGHVYLQ